MKLWLRFVALLTFGLSINVCALPQDFVYLSDIDPSIIQDMRYSTDNNFIGKRITGYAKGTCILTRRAALALAQIQVKLKKQGLGLKVYDCYRPQSAVNQFVLWSRELSDQLMKRDYYPHINKRDVFKLNYVARLSGHSRGSTVDLTIVQMKQVHSIWMGTHFDYLDPSSNPNSTRVDPKARNNRLFLQRLMHQHGFAPLETEWWHFTLRNEPFPHEYFNFPVK